MRRTSSRLDSRRLSRGDFASSGPAFSSMVNRVRKRASPKDHRNKIIGKGFLLVIFSNSELRSVRKAGETRLHESEQSITSAPRYLITPLFTDRSVSCSHI